MMRVVSQKAGEPPPCPTQAPREGRLRQTHRCGGVAVSEALPGNEHDRLALLRPQRLERLDQLGVRLRGVDRRLGDEPQWRLGGLAQSGDKGIVPALTPALVEDETPGDPVKPGNAGSGISSRRRHATTKVSAATSSAASGAEVRRMAYARTRGRWPR